MRGLVEIDQSLGERRVIVEEAIFFFQMREHVPCCSHGRRRVARLTQGEACTREGGDHQAVPRGNDLAIDRRLRPPAARSEQLLAYLLRHVTHAAQDAAPVEIAANRDAVRRKGGRGPLPAQRRLDFARGPCETVALDLFSIGPRAVRVARRPESAARIGHLAQDEVERLAHDARKAGASRDLPRLQIDDSELGVVVQHLLEMRLEPLCVGRVTMEAAAELIVDAARGHRLERVHDHLQGLRVTGAAVIAQ